jgi:hypothetical protein
MSNFGTRLAYPTPDWVAYRAQQHGASPRAPRISVPPVLSTIATALRRLVGAWVKAHNYNAYR